MGCKMGWLGASMKAFWQALREILAADYDFCILECTAHFDVTGLAVLQPKYLLTCLNICPRALGFPATRLRKYMLLTKCSSLRWRQSIVSMGHAEAFRALFNRKVVLCGDDLLRASDNEAFAYHDTLRMARGLPAWRRSGRRWRPWHLLTPVLRGKVLQHEMYNKRKASWQVFVIMHICIIYII